MDITLPILILAIPIAMFLILGIGGVVMPRKVAGILGILGMGTCAVLAYTVAFTYFFSGAPEFILDGVRQQFQVFDVTWLAFTEKLVVKIGFLLDPISAMMLVVITTISFFVHLYSWGYMEHEPGFQRYYAFLSLFTFSMLGLVVATNIFQMYIFWKMLVATTRPSIEKVKSERKSVVALETGLMFHIAPAVEMHHKRDSGDHDQHKSRDRIEKETDIDYELLCESEPGDIKHLILLTHTVDDEIGVATEIVGQSYDVGKDSCRAKSADTEDTRQLARHLDPTDSQDKEHRDRNRQN